MSGQFFKCVVQKMVGVPLPYVTRETNLANLQAARQQHGLLTVWPRVNRCDSNLNERLLPLHDDTGRLFFASDNAVPEELDYLLKQEKQDLDCGVRTVNEIRSERGLKPVRWGDEPWLPLTWAPASLKRRADYAPQTGRNADSDRNGS